MLWCWHVRDMQCKNYPFCTRTPASLLPRKYPRNPFLDPVSVQEPPPFLPTKYPKNPFLDSFLHRNPPPLPAQHPPSSTPSWTTSWCILPQAHVNVYPPLVLKAVDNEEMAKPLPVAPFEASRVIDGHSLG